LTELLTPQIYDVDGLERFDLSLCPWLHQLSITSCWLYELPSSIALLTDLMELDMSFNRFTSIDAIDFVRMSKLTSLDVSSRCRAAVDF
jgi:Leucine-rich repeat (LRR) protein